MKPKFPIIMALLGLALGVLVVFEYSRLNLSGTEVSLFALLQLSILSYFCFATSNISALIERVQKLEKAQPPPPDELM
jgi:hypothetical protein